MNQVDLCRREDIPAIAGLHLKVYGDSGKEPSDDLKAYYEEVLFGNPWCAEDIPSLVIRSKDGSIDGLVGVLTYPMSYKGKSIRMAVPHSFMVSPECRTPMAAIQMIRMLFDGSQDLVLGDGANDQARKLMEAMGAETALLYSMHWLRLLRPCSYMVIAMRTKPGLKGLSVFLRPACCLLDVAIRKLRGPAQHSDSTPQYTAVELGSDTLLSCINELTKHSVLHPEYGPEHIQWYWEFLQNNTRRGRPQGFEVRNEKGQRVGAYLYYLRTEKKMEVLMLWAREDHTQAVFNHLMDHASKCGAISVEGRMEPRFLMSISDHNVLMKHRRWVIAYSRDPEVLKVLQRGDAMLSPLEGELWVHSLSDKLHS